MAHTEVPIKVNAWIDKDVAPVVDALNEFKNVMTISSCQGYDPDPAHVFFCVRGGPDDLASFVHQLSVWIGKRVKACCEYRLQIEWVAGSETPMATLFTQLDYVEPLARAISELAEISDAHRKAS